jgi:glycerate-2-kinase
MNPTKLLANFFSQGLENCSPSNAIANAISVKDCTLFVQNESFDLRTMPVHLMAVGKAALPMYKAAASILGDAIGDSIVVTPLQSAADSCAANQVIQAAHPEPDRRSIEAGKAVSAFLQRIPKDGLVLNLLSGGTSSLLCMPADEISLEDLNSTFQLLNNSGATIHEINAVRKHCSQIKGGQLLRHLDTGATLIDLVISDVPDDDLSVIGSGPTTADNSTFEEACGVVTQYELWDQLPRSVRMHLHKGMKGKVPETVKPGADPVQHHRAYIISSARMLAEHIGELASGHGWTYRLPKGAFNADVEEVSREIVEDLRFHKEKDSSPRLFIYYGESTVKVSGDGKGGRNQELALRGALKIEGHQNITWLSAGTDGIDGPTGAAGAIVDGGTVSEARSIGLDPKKYVEQNDSYHFHNQMGTLLKTGPTGNNLMDIVLVLSD